MKEGLNPSFISTFYLIIFIYKIIIFLAVFSTAGQTKRRLVKEINAHT